MIYLSHYRTTHSNFLSLIENTPIPIHAYYFPELYKQKLKTGLFYIPHLLAEKVIDNELISTLKDTSVGKTAFILAAGNSIMLSGDVECHSSNNFKYNYKIPHFSIAQIYAARIAQRLKAQDLVLSDSGACASSLKVLTDVQSLIRLHGFDRVIVLATEDGTSNSMIEFFSSNQACLTYKQEQELGIKPSAFDDKNFGFYLSQGAVIAIFESEKAIKKNGVTPKAKLLGAGIGSEHSTNAIGQNEGGDGYRQAIDMAISASGISKNDIQIVKTHGTGTHVNNKSEKNALLKSLNNFVATSYKQKIGHTLGVSGLLETCLLLDDLNKGVIPKIENRTEKDTVFLSDDIKAINTPFLSLAAGMGNIYAAAILETC